MRGKILFLSLVLTGAMGAEASARSLWATLLIAEPNLKAEDIAKLRFNLVRAARWVDAIDVLSVKRAEGLLFKNTSLRKVLSKARLIMKKGIRYQQELKLDKAEKTLEESAGLYWRILPLVSTSPELSRIFARLAMVFLPQRRTADLKRQYRKLLRIDPRRVLDKSLFPPKARRLFALEKVKLILQPDRSPLLSTKRALNLALGMGVDYLLVAHVKRGDGQYHVRLQTFDGRSGTLRQQAGNSMKFDLSNSLRRLRRTAVDVIQGTIN